MATEPTNTSYKEETREVLAELGLTKSEAAVARPTSGHNSSMLIPCEGQDNRHFLLKYLIPPADGKYYPAGVRCEDYARRECAFYRYLDTMDPERRMLPAPRTIMLDSGDPPRWILLERIPTAVGPAEEVLSISHVHSLLQMLQQIPAKQLMGRRDFPLNRWDTLSYWDRVRLMYDPVLFIIGEGLWDQVKLFFEQALRWTESRPPTLVHGDFTPQNILVDEEGDPFLLDFERLGIGNEDHDFAWFWIHSDRSQEWKRDLLARYWSRHVGSARIRSEWGIRAALVYLALRRLRFDYLSLGEEAPRQSRNLALLDAALVGGRELFPI